MISTRGKSKTFLAAGFAVAVLAFTAPGSMAQDYEKLAPKTPAPASQGNIEIPAGKPIAPQQADKLLLGTLNGLRFVDSVQAIVRAGITEAGVNVYGNLALLNDPVAKSQLAAFLGKPLHAHDLSRISEIVLAWYRGHALPIVDVAFPEQDISTGTVQAVVTVYRLGRVKVEGNRWFSSALLKDTMSLRPGQTIDVDVLKQDLNRLNQNPFRQVGAVMERSDTVGDTDIALHVVDRFPYRLYVGYDNEGLPVTGRERYSAGFNVGNLFGWDQQLSYQFLTSPDLWRSRPHHPGQSSRPPLTAHSISYQVPLPWGDTLSAFGTAVEMVPNLGPFFGQIGRSAQLSFRYAKSLPLVGTMLQEIQFGFDYKRSDNNLAFGGTQIFASTTNVEQFLLIYDATIPDRHGQTTVENDLVLSPGGLSRGNGIAAFAGSGTNGAKPEYAYDHMQVTHVFELPKQFSALLRLAGQLSSAELLPSEQLGAGGIDSVRGYDPHVANGSQGALASIEFRSPTFSPLGNVSGGNANDQFQALAFYDFGYVSYKHRQQGLPESAALQSAGAGLRYSLGRYVTADFDYGWQLAKAPGAKSLGNLATISVTLSY